MPIRDSITNTGDVLQTLAYPLSDFCGILILSLLDETRLSSKIIPKLILSDLVQRVVSHQKN
jgi:hypothetical protein